MESKVFEVWESPDGQFRFCFSHNDTKFTTGVLIMQPGTELPKHNRPKISENLLQVSGRCKMIVFSDEGEVQEERILEAPQGITFNKAEWHIHANPFDEVSVTLFKGEGDMTAIIQKVRETFKRVV